MSGAAGGGAGGGGVSEDREKVENTLPKEYRLGATPYARLGKSHLYEQGYIPIDKDKQSIRSGIIKSPRKLKPVIAYNNATGKGISTIIAKPGEFITNMQELLANSSIRTEIDEFRENNGITAQFIKRFFTLIMTNLFYTKMTNIGMSYYDIMRMDVIEGIHIDMYNELKKYIGIFIPLKLFLKLNEIKPEDINMNNFVKSIFGRPEYHEKEYFTLIFGEIMNKINNGADIFLTFSIGSNNRIYMRLTNEIDTTQYLKYKRTNTNRYVYAATDLIGAHITMFPRIELSDNGYHISDYIYAGEKKQLHIYLSDFGIPLSDTQKVGLVKLKDQINTLINFIEDYENRKFDITNMKSLTMRGFVVTYNETNPDKPQLPKSPSDINFILIPSALYVEVKGKNQNTNVYNLEGGKRVKTKKSRYTRRKRHTRRNN